MLTESVLIEQNRQLRAENEELRETVRQLKERIDAPTALPLPDGLPYLTPHEEIVFRALYHSRRVMSRDALYAALYGVETEVDLKIVDVWIFKLRRKLADVFTIETSKGRGWCIAGRASGQSGDTSGFIAEALEAA